MVENKKNGDSEVLNKFLEKLTRKLGEIAILIHLSQTPEGDHAYNIRGKASEILFQRKKKSLEFIEKHLETIKQLEAFSKFRETESEKVRRIREEIENSLENCPVLKFNPHIQNILTREKEENLQQDVKYIMKKIESFEIAKSELESLTMIWGNVSSIYPAIEYLEKNGFIIFTKESSEGGRLKKIYEITELGKKALSLAILSLVDITSFIYRLEGKKIFFKEARRSMININPFGKLFHDLIHDLPKEFRRKVLIKGKRHSDRPFTRMMNEHGLPFPNPHLLIQHPELISKFLEQIDSDSERALTKALLKTKLNDYIKKASQVLEELK
ncbi:MAG: PadR family transcriptional regulator [Candidatus Heimdallarchaeaceae archaeon]